MTQAKKIPGKRVLLALFALVFTVAGLLVVWAKQAPNVSDARDRMKGMALPGVRE